MSDIWAACGGITARTTLSATVWRMVEGQEEIATMGLVDNLDQQAELERILERSKPPAPAGRQLHYLLSTPFRYPPLRHGSRFGGRHEPSMFYGSLDGSALLAETAYYRFVFASGPATPFPTPLVSLHTAFSVNVRTDQGARLELPPFNSYRARLTSATGFRDTQALGNSMRQAGIQAFTSTSARDPAGGRNACLFTPDAFAKDKPTDQSTWSCTTTADVVSLREHGGRGVSHFRQTDFLVEGVLPAPAV